MESSISFNMGKEHKEELYEDRVLLKLRRKYSKDETVAALSKKVELLEVEKGKLLSEIEYLEHTIKELKSSVNNKEILDLVRNSDLYLQQQKILKQRGELIRKLHLKIRSQQ